MYLNLMFIGSETGTQKSYYDYEPCKYEYNKNMKEP